MDEQFVFTRRDFLKLVGVGAAGASAGCASRPAERLIPYLIAPNDVLPGVPYWYASTCRECPAGCGILAKAREGRVIKVEGNPEHPVNRGALCARGQASVQGLYDPDRIKSPMARVDGVWRNISWAEAIAMAADKLGEARRLKQGIALVTEHATGSFDALSADWARAAGAERLVFEPFAYETVREANRRTFGRAEIPNYDFASATCVFTFGADFVDTWINPVGNALGFSAMHREHPAALFVAIEPRLSLTGASADEWVAIRPGTEAVLALGMARVILDQRLGPPVSERAALFDAVSEYTPEAVEKQTDIPAGSVTRLAQLFATAKPGLAVAGGIAAQSEQSVAAVAAVNLLNYVAGNVGRTVRFDRTLNYDSVGSLSDLQRLAGRMAEGDVQVLVVQGANPVYATPTWAGFGDGMEKVPFKISLSPVMDETTERCDLILPAAHTLESLGDAEPARGIHSIIQPGMRPVPAFDTRSPGESLLAVAHKAGFGDGLAPDWDTLVKNRWRELHKRFGKGLDFDAFWDQTLQKGGVWEDVSAPAVRWVSTPAMAVPQMRGEGDFTLVVFPTSLYDGRGANKAWLQELPDPTTKAVWGSWVEIHPETAARLGVKKGDTVEVKTDAGARTLPVQPNAGIRKDTIAIPLGQGHVAYGRYASGRGVNALDLLPPAQDAAAGALAYLSVKASLTKSPAKILLAHTQRDFSQEHRGVGRSVTLTALYGLPRDQRVDVNTPRTGIHAVGEYPGEMENKPGGISLPSQHKPGKYTEPRETPPGYKPPAHSVSAYQFEEVVRSPRQIPVDKGSYKNATHRWAMAIDLDSCNGCSACLVACSAENNVPTVGPDMITHGREMLWIRIIRIEEQIGDGKNNGKNDVRFVPMMCQHCGNAPCEIVCPVYATYHNPEGLNVQVYNRCVGTRYCSNNCPYKVRAFNFYDYAAPEKPSFAFPEPLNWQLNPDVTVRSKGVMEKCTMCVQRILEGKGNARDENRKLKDGDIQTACQQTCPTRAITFGDLLDPDSEVAKQSYGERAYWPLDELNTRPGVTYLKKIERETT